MPDILVTTPKNQGATAAAEAEDAKRYGGDTEYFRWFPVDRGPNIHPGERIWYVENGHIRGFGIVSRVLHQHEQSCDTTGREWGEGQYVFYRADSWQWVRPIPYTGFQGFRYAYSVLGGVLEERNGFEVLGGWLDRKPLDTPLSVQVVEADYRGSATCGNCGHARRDHYAALPAPCTHGRTNPHCLDPDNPAYGCRCTGFVPERVAAERMVAA